MAGKSKLTADGAEQASVACPVEIGAYPSGDDREDHQSHSRDGS